MLSVLPFALKYLFVVAAGKQCKIASMFADGELLLVTCVIAGELLSEIVTGSHEDQDSRRVFLTALALIASIVAAVFYGIVAWQGVIGGSFPIGQGGTQGTIAIKPMFVASISVILFTPVAISAGYVKYTVNA